MQSLFSSHLFMSELRRSLRVLDREEDAFEPLADELVEVVLGMLDTKSLGRTVCCNRRLQQLASAALRDREEKLATIRSLVLERNEDASAPRSGFAAIEEAILPAVSILRAEARHDAPTATQLCGFLCRATVWKELQSSVGEAGGIDAVVAASRAYPHHALLQLTALFTICNLQNEDHGRFHECNEEKPFTRWSRPSIAAGGLSWPPPLFAVTRTTLRCRAPLRG